MDERTRRSIVVIENFYRDPETIRAYGLRQPYYAPYEDQEKVRAGRVRATWWASAFRPADECRFKSSERLIAAIEAALGETIDREHWRAPFPIGSDSKPLAVPPN